MAAGLQAFDASGTLCFDSNSNTTRILGSVNTGTSNGSITVPEFATKKGWAVINYIVTDTREFGPLSMSGMPQISISGTKLSWNFGSFNIDPTYDFYLDALGASKHNISVNVLYGVYL